MAFQALLRPVRHLTSAARQFTTRHPLLGNCTLYVALYSMGEMTPQTVRGEKQFDWTSIRNVALLGSCLFAPFNFTWYRILDRYVTGSGLRIAIKKVACDQLVAGVCGIFMFYIGLAVLEGRKDKFGELKQKGLATYKVGCVYWPSIQMFNFLFLPAYLRTAYVGCGAFCWTNILCYFKNKKVE